MNTRLHTLFLLTFLVMPFALFGETIFSTKLDDTSPTTGVTVTGSSCSLADVPGWATGYTKGFQTGGSSGKATISFESELFLSDFTDVKLTIHWGAENGRPLKVAMNGGSATTVHSNLVDADRKKVVEDTYSITVSSIKSIALSSGSGSGTFFFDISITGTRTTPIATNTRTVCLNPNVPNWKIGNERYAVYCFGDGEEWYDMTKVTDGCGMTYYKADVDLKYTAYIFCRMNGGTTENIWENKWNQTNDLPKATGTYCTITSGGGGDTKAGCNWNHTPFEICISGPDVAFADAPLVLEAKCPGATYFQWYKGGTADANKIEGATSATYRKAKCAFEDAGTYYCKAGGSESAVRTSSGHNVKMYRAYFNNGRDGGEYGYVDIKHNIDIDPSKRQAAGMIFLGESWNYAFSITDGFNHWYGNNNDESHKMQNGNSTNWNFTLGHDKCWLRTDNGATYKIIVDYTTTPLKVSLVFPPDHQEAGKMIYFANDIVNWDETKLHYRIGKAVNPEHPEVFPHTQKEPMTKVKGTANFFQYETKEYNNLHAWHVANNCGWSGTGANGTDNTRSIYLTDTGDEFEITHSVTFEGGATTQNITIIPQSIGNACTDSKPKSECDPLNGECKFHSYDMYPGMLTHNVEITEPDPAQGTLTVNYMDIDGNEQTFTSGDRDLAHTCYVYVTAEPICGYKKPTEIFINGAPHGNGAQYILTEDIIVSATLEVAEYSINYKLNGGTINSGEVIEYTFGVGATLPTDVTRAEYEFLGWYDNAGCTGTPVTEITTTDCGNKVYWAKWEKGKPAPVFTWDCETTIKAGGIYPVSVASTGDADVTLSIVETIAGVTGSFTDGNPATGIVTLGSYPAATTFTYQAYSPETSTYKEKTETKTITIERCETEDAIPMAGSEYVAESSASDTHARYYCEESGVGRISYKTGNSSISSSSFKSGTNDIFEYYIEGKTLLLEPYTDIHKIELYVNCGTNNQTLTGVYKRDTYSKEEDDYTTSASSTIKYYTGSTESTYLPYKTTGHVEIAFASPIPKGTFIYIVSPKQMNIYGAKLYRPEGDEPTSVEFSGEAEIEKYPGDAPFTNAATQTTTPVLSGGSITYKSSDETVATVDANTGEVNPIGVGRTVITATLQAYGCFDEATATYSVVVKKCIDPECTIAVTSGTARKCAGESVTMTATAVEGAVVQWFKDGVPILGETGASYTTTEAGEYYATATKTCLQVSNTIVVENLAAPTAVALHDYYYIKAGRERPDISLFQLTNVKIDPSSFTMSHPAPDGCSYELREDGIVYLVGTPSLTLAAADYDLTLTTVNDCGFTNASATMHLYSLETTAKPQIAWIATGTKGQTLPGNPTASQSTDHTLYKYLQNFFDMTAVNAYCTTDEKKISDYCSQFDLVLLTDYPDTHVTPTSDNGKKSESYSNAFGCLMDELPLLSFEAFVADCPNWGINSDPKTPDPTQKDMTLLCSTHNIFAGTTIDISEKIPMLSAISGNGLQGFTGLEAPPGMLNIATVDNNESNGGTLVVCCERQKVIEARMMIMGLNYKDMGNLTDDGKLVVKQIIEYLLQFKEMADCSIVFDDNNNTHVWSDPKNWYPAYNALPKPLQAVRVDKPCQVDIMNAHCSSIRLRKDGAGGWNGTLTIQPNGGLTVVDYIKEVHGTNFMTTYPSAAGDLVIQAGENGQNGSLVFGSVEDDLQATVEYYSLAKDANVSGKKPVWQYIGIPITDGPLAIDAYHAAWMCSWESEGNVSSNWVWVENEDKIRPFKGYCITQAASKKYIHKGSLSKPETKDLPLYYFESEDGDGFNMFANSWVAPIDITKMETEDFGGAAEPTIFIYNTGTREQYDEQYTDPLVTDGMQVEAGQFNAIPVKAASYLDGSLTKIPTMQGFFIQASKEGTMTLDYKKLCFNTETYSTTAETMRAPKRTGEEPAEEPVTEKIVPEVMRIDVVSANWGDRLYILMHPEFSDAFDRGWDGSKQEGDADAPMLALERGNGLLAVAAVESADERYLAFRAGKDTEYTFRFNYDGETIYLYDHLTGQATRILTGNTYSFKADDMTPINRFLITKNPPKVPTDIPAVDQEMTAQPQKYIDHGQLFILYHGRVYDMTGKRVAPRTGKEETR